MTSPFCILISLKRSEARRKRAISELKKTTLKWEILDGIDGLLLSSNPPEYRERKVSRLLGFPLMPSEIGCFLSHRSAWIRCVEKNCSALILEDDFKLNTNFQEALFTLSTQYLEWDIARLQGLYETTESVIATGPDYKITRNLADPLGATAYIIKPNSALRLIQYSNEIYEPLDHFLEHDKKHHLKIVAFKPYPVRANGMVSTMHDRSIRTPIKGLKKWFRSFYRLIDRLFSSDPWFPK